MGRSGKGLTTSLTFSRKGINKKQKARNTITDITNQYFSSFLKEFKILPYIGYNRKQVNNEPNEAHFFLIKDISKLIKSKNHVPLRTKIIKSDVVKTICVDKTIENINETDIILLNG